MPRSHPAIHAFNGGELSPLLDGRSDLAKYQNGCRRLENAIPTVQGAAKRRGGTRFVAGIKADGNRTWLARFVFSRSQAYVLEFGPLYVRFYTGRAPLVSGGVVEVVTPYTAGDLTTSDGTFGLDIEQRGDVLYIACEGRAPQTLTRLTLTSWALAPFVTTGGPLLDQNPNEALRLQASAQTGTVTVTASAAFFTAAHVGALLRLDLESIDIPPWEPAKNYAASQLVRSDGKTYQAQNAGGTRISGSRLPIHEQGDAVDGSGQTTDTPARDIGIVWRYQDPGYGIGRITAFTSSTQVSVLVEEPFPTGVVSVPTNQWQIGAWGAHAEWPSRVFFWKGRLGFAGRRSIWMSVPRAYSDFSRDIVGQVRADAGITVEIESTSEIRSITPGDQLLAHTDDAEFLIDKGTDSEPLGPGNIDADEVSAYGSRRLQALRISTGVVFCEPSGRRIRQVRNSQETGQLEAPDLTVLAEHILRSPIVDWAWQASPDRVLWMVLADGRLVGMTLDEEQQVLAWHRHPTDGLVEAVQVIPSPDGARDEVWLIVRRTIAGTPRRLVEYMDRGFEYGDMQSSAYFVDCGISYSGAPVSTISGLAHLVGATVDVCANGGAHPPRVVQAGGTITLQNPASVVHVGLPMRTVIVPMLIEGGAARGTSQGKTKRVSQVQLRLLESLGVKVGPTVEEAMPIAFRTSADRSGRAPGLFSGIVDIDFDGDYGPEAQICIVQDQPLPLTVTALMVEVTTNERG